MPNKPVKIIMLTGYLGAGKTTLLNHMHDAKKKLMQNFCIAYRGILSKHNLYATETTGILVENVTNLSIHKYLAGHLGGKQQLGSQIEHNQMDLLIFFRDPLTPHSHEPDVNDIVKLCDIYNIPIATNIGRYR